MLHTLPLEALSKEAAAVRMVVCISLEEILPRPKAGLLSRMLRLADVSLVSSPNTVQPVYLLHPGGEYHIGVSLFHPPAGQRVPVGGAAWVRVAVSDGQAVTMDIEQDQGMFVLQYVEVPLKVPACILPCKKKYPHTCLCEVPWRLPTVIVCFLSCSLP